MEENKETPQSKAYACKDCASKSEGEPGTCCGAERKEACPGCGQVRKDDGTCGCA